MRLGSIQQLNLESLTVSVVLYKRLNYYFYNNKLWRENISHTIADTAYLKNVLRKRIVYIRNTSKNSKEV